MTCDVRLLRPYAARNDNLSLRGGYKPEEAILSIKEKTVCHAGDLFIKYLNKNATKCGVFLRREWDSRFAAQNFPFAALSPRCSPARIKPSRVRIPLYGKKKYPHQGIYFFAERVGFAFCCAKLSLRCAQSSMLASSHQALTGSNPTNFVNIKKPPFRAVHLAERVGFEPTIPFGIRALQARALDQLCDLSNPCGKNYIIRIFKLMKNEAFSQIIRIWSLVEISNCWFFTLFRISRIVDSALI